MVKLNPGVADLPRAVHGEPPTDHPEYVNVITKAWEDINDEEEGYGRPRSIPEAGPYRGSFASKRCDRALFYAMSEEECELCLGRGEVVFIDGGNDFRPLLPHEPSGEVRGGDQCPKCAGVGLQPLAASNLPTIADMWRFWLGKVVHGAIEGVVPVSFPNDRSEVVVDLRMIGVPGSAHADQVSYYSCPICGGEGYGTHTDEHGTDYCENCGGSGHLGARDVIEYKSVNGLGFKYATTNFKGEAQGPRSGVVLQAAMVAVALGAERVVVANLALENMSPNMAKSFANSELARFAAEWHYPIEEVEEMVAYEVKRINRLVKYLGGNVLPARELHDDKIPRGAVVDDPNRGTWKVQFRDERPTAAGSTWMCGYCPQLARCLEDGPS